MHIRGWDHAGGQSVDQWSLRDCERMLMALKDAFDYVAPDKTCPFSGDEQAVAISALGEQVKKMREAAGGNG